MLRRDRYVVLAGVLAVAGLAWAYTVYLAWDMRGTEMSSGMSMGSTAMGRTVSMPMTAGWSALDFGLMYLMWAVMMVAMMVPTAAPMILMFGTVARKRKEQDRPYVPTGVFVLG